MYMSGHSAYFGNLTHPLSNADKAALAFASLSESVSDNGITGMSVVCRSEITFAPLPAFSIRTASVFQRALISSTFWRPSVYSMDCLNQSAIQARSSLLTSAQVVHVQISNSFSFVAIFQL